MKTKPAPISAGKKKSPSSTRPRSKAKSPPEAIEADLEPPSKPLKPKRAAVKKLKDNIVSAYKSVKRSVTRTPAARAKNVEIPPLMLEGDQPAPPAVSGPGQKFALGPVPPAQHPEPAEAELPEAYGTKKLFLTARDPHWLYAHWDLTRDQQMKLNARSADGHLILRIYAGRLEGHPICEIHVHPESRHWFAHVERAGSSYAAELDVREPVA